MIVSSFLHFDCILEIGLINDIHCYGFADQKMC